MSTSMPEFAMPVGAHAASRPAVASPPVADDAASQTDAAGGPPPLPQAPEPRRRRWRGYLVAGLVGAVIGAATPGALLLIERSETSNVRSQLEQATMDYLTALAEGRAADANAMVPVPVGMAPPEDGPLQSAERLENPEIRLVAIDGNDADVAVRFTVGGTDVERSLVAERVFGQWHVTTSLAESAWVTSWTALDPTVGGVPIVAEEPILLYPASYTMDAVETAVFTAVASPFVVDGDPLTMTQAWLTPELRPSIARDAGDIAIQFVRECLAAGGCSEVGDDADLTASSTSVFAQTSTGLQLEVFVTGPTDGNGINVEISLSTDGEQVTAWRCRPIGDRDAPEVPCPIPSG